MSRRTFLAAVVLAAAAIAVAAFVAVRSFSAPSRLAPRDEAGRRSPAPAAAPVPPPAPPTARVESASGPVRVRRGGVESDAAAGTAVEADDVLATGPGGRAEIRVDDQTSVILEPGTTVAWGTITETLSSVALDSGYLSASTGAAGGRVFRVQALDRTATVEASAGRFDVAGNGEGLTVAAAAGEVTVRSGGEAVRVDAGAYTTVRRGARPGTPRQLPGNVVAEIFWPGQPSGEGERLVAERSVVVRGRIGEGVAGVLTVRNERTGETFRVTTRPDGSFETEVALAADESNPLVLDGTSVGGRPIAARSATIVQDSTPPPLNVRIQ